MSVLGGSSFFGMSRRGKKGFGVAVLENSPVVGRFVLGKREREREIERERGREGKRERDRERGKEREIYICIRIHVWQVLLYTRTDASALLCMVFG